MSHWPVDQQESVDNIFGSTQLKYIVDSFMKSRKVSPQDEVTYETVDVTDSSGKHYTITGNHVPIESVMKHGSGSCKHCNGKGYWITYLPKHRIPNPQDFVILSEEPLTDMSEERKKLWMEVEKKKTTWKIMLPCKCAIKGFTKHERNIVTNHSGNVMIKLTYEVKNPT